MIVLDTNVLSELMRGGGASPRVLTWVRALRVRPVTTVLNRAEVLAGLALLPGGGRRDALLERSAEVLGELGASLPFSSGCDVAFAEVVARRTRLGRPIEPMDALIAAIARVHGASVATRDVEGFAGLGIDVVDPWSA